MKKRIIALSMICAMALTCLAGCNDSSTVVNPSVPNESSNISSSASSENNSGSNDNGYPQGDQELVNSWGYEYHPRIEGANYKINTLSQYPRPTAYGLLRKENGVPEDGYNYLITERMEDDLNIPEKAEKSDKVFSTFEKELFRGLAKAEEIDLASKDQKFEVTSTENVKINEYDMTVTKGKYKFYFDYGDNKGDRSYDFVAYGTLLTNGTPVLWMCFDQSEDQSKGSEMEDTALKMAKTLREFDPEAE